MPLVYSFVFLMSSSSPLSLIFFFSVTTHAVIGQ